MEIGQIVGVDVLVQNELKGIEAEIVDKFYDNVNNCEMYKIQLHPLKVVELKIPNDYLWRKSDELYNI